MRRVVVVGAGIAGTMAALAAARAGAMTTVLGLRPGASALVGGAFGLGGELAGLPRAHPLRGLGIEPVRMAGEVDAAVGEFAAMLGRGGAPVFGDWRRPGRYADLHGRQRAAGLVPKASAPGELEALRASRRPVIVVGFERVSDYDAESTARALVELVGIPATAEVLAEDGLPPGASIADLVGRPAPRVRTKAPALVAYPPGLSGLPDGAFELLANLPSPFGLAVQSALDAALAGARVNRLRAPAERLLTDGRMVTAALCDGGEVEGDAFVLATGGFIGGGLAMHRRPAERVAGVTAWSGAQVATADRGLAHRLYIDPGAAFGLGVRTDERLRPLDEDGRAAFDNLRAAGALLGGHEPESSALLAAVTGRLAGLWSAA